MGDGGRRCLSVFFSGGALCRSFLLLLFFTSVVVFIHNPFFIIITIVHALQERAQFFLSTAWLNGQRREANQIKNSQAKNKPSGPSEFLCAHWISAVKTKWRHRLIFTKEVADQKRRRSVQSEAREKEFRFSGPSLCK